MACRRCQCVTHPVYHRQCVTRARMETAFQIPCHPDRSRGIFAPPSFLCQRITYQRVSQGGSGRNVGIKQSNPLPLGSSEESEKPRSVSRRLFAYFLVGEKVGPRRNHKPRALRTPILPCHPERSRGISAPPSFLCQRITHQGDSKGGEQWKRSFQTIFCLLPSFGRPKSPRNLRKFLGDSLPTFSSVRK